MTAPATTDLVRRWRAETPGTDRLVHLNNAGAALVPAPVAEAVAGHLRLESELGAYEAAEARAEAVQEAHALVGRLVGVGAGNIALLQNSTFAFTQALGAFDFQAGDVLLTSRADYASNQIMYLSLARRLGVEIVRAADLPEGGMDPESVRTLVARRRPALVSVSWVPTNSGLVQAVEAVGAVCREAEVPYLVDACQAVGQMPVELDRIGCDFLAGTARKFLRGPRGVGFLAVADRALARGAYPLLVDMHGADWTAPDEFRLTPDARRFESWEISFALVLGVGAAAAYALEVGLEQARDRARALAGYARARLARIRGVRVLDRGAEQCAIVTIDPAGRPGPEVKLALRRRGINTSSPERLDAVIDMDEKAVSSALRISPHYYNTVEEVDVVVAAIEELLHG